MRIVINDNRKRQQSGTFSSFPGSSSCITFQTVKCAQKRKMTIIVFILAIGLIEKISGSSDLRVTLKQGILEGVRKTNKITKEPYYAFLGIPFAKPPIREKRFKDPEDPLPWNGILNATQEGSPCMTYNVILKYTEGDEDCLYLNIYTLKKSEDIKESPRPVMVWIHGGAFMSGSGSPSDYGPDFLVRHDIVLVTINYRLNVFGFLSVQNDLVPGNAGLKDQVKALKWIRENIGAFGGDTNSVTIFGGSAGGASVHYLMLSPSAKGLFHRAIAQSGVALNPWASTRDVKDTAFKLGEVFDCNTRNSYELVDCLQQVKAKDLAAYQFNILSMKSSEFLTKNINLPCVESRDTKNGFLTEIPQKIMEKGNFNDVPFLLGVTKSETLLLNKLFSEELPVSVRNLIIDQINLKPELLLPRNLATENPESAKRAGIKMKEFYFQNKTISNETVDNLINATSDSWFVYGVHETALLHSGPSHGDDLKYFFYMWNKDIQISPDEMEKISKINNLWINFSKFGNPTPNNNSTNIVWKPFTQNQRYYLEIGDEFVMKNNLEKERMHFWENLTVEESLFYH